MESVEFARCGQQVWDTVCEESEDAWFWHRWDWVRYAERYTAQGLIANLSFLVSDGGRPLAVVPCFAERRDSARVLGFNREQIFWPAVVANAGDDRRQCARDFVFSQLAKLARQYELSRIETINPVLAPAFYRSTLPPTNIPARYGYNTTLQDTQVIDLRLPQERLWDNVRKGHKACIRAGGRMFEVRALGKNATDEDFRAYQDMHALAAGRVTRSQDTFDMMRDWLRTGRALLMGAMYDGVCTGFAYFIVSKRGGYYASACRHPNLPANTPVGHVLTWNAILTLQRQGVEILEMGPQTYVATLGADAKAVGISHFKRGFGGTAIPRYLGMLDMAAV